MKLHLTRDRNQALTLVEVLVVIVVLVILAVMLIPINSDRPMSAKKIACRNNLKQVGLGEMLWAGDHSDLYPADVSMTDGGTKEIFSPGSQFQNIAFLDFLILSNKLGAPQILHCPSDTIGFAATNFTTGFCNQNVSYFIGLDADRNSPQGLTSGDDNFEIAGVPLTSGLQEISTNAPISWTTARHSRVGNILSGDGSVQSSTSYSLRSYWQQSGHPTNRLIIP